MFDFERRDDGYVCRQADGRVVCSVECVVGIDEQRQQKDGRMELVTVRKVLDEKLLHFTSVKLTPAQVKALVEEVEQLNW